MREKTHFKRSKEVVKIERVDKPRRIVFGSSTDRYLAESHLKSMDYESAGWAGGVRIAKRRLSVTLVVGKGEPPEKERTKRR